MIFISQKTDASAIAAFHHQTINQGFLSKLGIGFLQLLYRFLISKELVLVYKEGNEVLGFVSCTLSSGNIMKKFLFSYPSAIFKLMLLLIRKRYLIKPLWETYHVLSRPEASTESGFKLPKTELLSISISPRAQKKGIGTQLLLALEADLKEKGISKYKVVAGEKLDGANKFYVKNGFVLVKQIKIHGDDISNVYVKNL